MNMRQNTKSGAGVPAFFFMHIAKTAGSFVNHSLKQVFDGKFVDHCEIPLRSPLQMDGRDHVIGWSGHVYLRRWLSIEREVGLNTRKFTLLRDPWHQLASHIQWLDHYNLEEHRAEFVALDTETQAVVRQVGETDIEDVGDLDRLLTNLSPRGIQYFDNCQSRYFLADFQVIKPRDPLHLGMRSSLVEAIELFDFIGRDEDLAQLAQAFSRILDTDIPFGTERINTAKSLRRVQIEQEDVREVMKKRLLLDLWLYNRVSAREDMPGHDIAV